VIGAVLGLSAHFLLPHTQATFTDWQIRHAGKIPSSHDLVVISLEKQNTISCGASSWNREELADTINGLQKAQASVIALLFPLPGSASPQCGGILGDAKLIESMREATLILPANSASLYTESATAVGHTDLPLGLDGVLRQLPGATYKDRTRRETWGQIVAETFLMQNPGVSESLTQDAQPTAWIHWSDQSSPKFSYTQIQPLLQRPDDPALRDLVRSKIVVLAPPTDGQPMMGTPWGNPLPESFAHIEILQQSLLGHSLTSVSTMFLVLTIALIAWRTSSTVATYPCKTSIIILAVMIFLYGALGWIALTTMDWIIPIFSPLVTLVLTAILTELWKVTTQQNLARSLITRREQELAALKQELFVKEERMADLAQQLQIAERATAFPIGPAAADMESFERLQEQLRETTEEVQQYRRQLDHLETQLSTLRQKGTPYSEDLAEDTKETNAPLHQHCQALGIVTRDPHILRLLADLKKAAQTNSPILLTGETGTGKEIFAKAAHTLSPRVKGPLIAVNVAAIRPELFESEMFGHARGAYTGAVGAKGFVEAASHGTLFLDEIGEIPIHLQAKLLRLLEDGTYYRVGEARSRTADIRIVAATNQDLWQETQLGRFRADLFHRLKAFSFHLPPLRERIPEDRQLLAQFFIQEIAQQLGQDGVRLTKGAMDAICTASWPGNIRELKHAMIQAVTLSENSLITEEYLGLQHPAPASPHPVTTHKGPDIRPMPSSPGHPLDGEDHEILAVLRAHRFDIQATAKVLRCDRGTVTQRLKGLGFQTLVRYKGNIEEAAQELAGDEKLIPRVQEKLREYYRNLMPRSPQPSSVEVAIADCRRRMKNLPDRYFISAETLLRWSFCSPEKEEDCSSLTT